MVRPVNVSIIRKIIPNVLDPHEKLCNTWNAMITKVLIHDYVSSFIASKVEQKVRANTLLKLELSYKDSEKPFDL